MSGEIFILVEGYDSELQIIESLKTCFDIKLKSKVIRVGAFGTSIYSLYKEICDDSDLDLFGLIKEKGRKKINDLKKYLENSDRSTFSPKQQRIIDCIEDLLKCNVADVSEVFLFFDYDGHCSNASVKKMQMMLDKFENETEKGKLYVSYPMVEALKHVKEINEFRDLKAIANPNYKKEVNSYCSGRYIDFKKYNKSIWSVLIEINLKKANYIVSKTYDYPREPISQRQIFDNQYELYISKKKNEVAVLSAFPLFLFDYFGVSWVEEELKKQSII